HPDHEVARRLLPAGKFGAMVSFEIAGADRPAVERFVDSLELCLNAATLGDLSTGLSYPVVSSHRGLTPAERALAGIPDNLARMAVGIERVGAPGGAPARALEGAGAGWRGGRGARAPAARVPRGLRRPPLPAAVRCPGPRLGGDGRHPRTGVRGVDRQ